MFSAFLFYLLRIPANALYNKLFFAKTILFPIAKFVGLTEKNISVRLTRIRKKMKQYLIEREVFV